MNFISLIIEHGADINFEAFRNYYVNICKEPEKSQFKKSREIYLKKSAKEIYEYSYLLMQYKPDIGMDSIAQILSYVNHLTGKSKEEIINKASLDRRSIKSKQVESLDKEACKIYIKSIIERNGEFIQDSRKRRI